MKAILFIVGLISLMTHIQAQTTIQGTIVDASSKKGIPYTNIGIIKAAKGTVSDFNGKYTLEVQSDEDVITISSIGYETVQLKARILKTKKIIELAPKKYELDAVVIKSSRFKNKEIILGSRNEKREHSIGFGSTQLGTEIGAIIRVKKATYIKSANFVLNHAKGDSLLFRINIYQFKDGKIGQNLLTEPIFIQEKQRKGTISVDMQKYNLLLKSDVLLTLEWLRNFDQVGNKAITFDTKKVKKKDGRGVYVRYSSNAKFIKLPYKTKVKPCFYFKGKEVLE